MSRDKALQFKSFKLDHVDHENGTVEGYASTFGTIDKVNDVVVPGAFKSAVINGPERVRFLWEHDRKEVIGGILDMREDERGLWIKARFGSSQRAQETRANMKDGFIDSFSIGYRVLREERGSVRGKSVNFLKEIQLLEVSCVAWPCNVEARMTAIKSEIDDRFDDLDLEQQALVSKFIDFLANEKAEPKPSDDEALEDQQESAGDEIAEEDAEDAQEAPESVNDDDADLVAIADQLALLNVSQALRRAL